MIVKFILFCFGILTFETLFSQNRLDCKNTGDCKQGVYSYNGWVCEYENNKLNGISIVLIKLLLLAKYVLLELIKMIFQLEHGFILTMKGMLH